MGEESKKLSIEFLEKWTRPLNYYSDVREVFLTEGEFKEFVGGINFILCALRGDTNILRNSYPK